MKVKFLSVMLIVLVMVSLMPSFVKAANNSFKAVVTPTTAELKANDEIVITLQVKEINMGENGINTVEGTLEYDKEIFEEVKSSSIQNLGSWNTTYNDEEGSSNGKFLAMNLSNVKEDSNVFSVKLKIKSDVKETKETIVKFKGITSNDGTDLVNVGDKTVKIKVAGKEAEKTEDTENGNKGEEGKTKGDNTTAKKKLPKTGESNAIAITAVGLVAIAVIFYIKIRKMN